MSPLDRRSAPYPSRWRVLPMVLLVSLEWVVAFIGLGAVFAPGEWQLWAMGVVLTSLVIPAVLRVARPTARLGPCFLGLPPSLLVAVVPAWEQGRVAQWMGDPTAMLGEIRVRLVTGNAPVAVDGALLDGILVACVVLVWASTLLVVGMDAGVLALVLPAALLLVAPAVLGLRVDGWLVAATALVFLGAVWVGAPPRVSRWRGGIAAVAALLVAVLVVAVLPASRDRVWNTSGVSLSPVSGDVPDVTVALGDDLRQGSTTEVFRFTGQLVGTSQRFPLAVLADLDGGTWKPLQDTDSTLAAQPQRMWLMTGDASLYQDLSVNRMRGQYSTTFETTSLVSSWLPLPLNAIEVTPVQGGSDDSSALDASDWSWVSGTATARSSTSLTSRGTSYSAVGIPYLVSSSALREGEVSAQMASWPVAFSATSAVSADSGADTQTLAESLAPYLELPGDVPTVITRTAKEVTSGAQDRFTAAADLVNWFTSGDFTYDELAPYTPGTDSDDPYSVMEAFLTTRSGYCVHYASTFTVMARSLGIPTRLVVGYAARFTAGGTGVTARNLHAWPEVYFEGVGWVAFEPTPGGAGWRADTGSDETAPEEALPGATPSASASASADDSVEPTASPDTSEGSLDADAQTQSGSASGEDDGSTTSGVGVVPVWAWVLMVVVLVLLVVLGAPGVVRRWCRHRRLGSVSRGGPGAASAAWEEFVDTARDLGWWGTDEGLGGAPRAHTPEALVEYLASVGALGGEAEEAARFLAGAVVAERFGDGGAAAPDSGVLRDALDAAVAGLGQVPPRGGMPARVLRFLIPASVLPSSVSPDLDSHPHP